MNSIAMKRRLAHIYRAIAAAGQGTRVLLYHAIGPAAGETPETEFTRHAAWLARNFAIVDLETALDAGGAGASDKLAITFDDGYASLADTALPVLSACSAVATVYVTAGWISGTGRKRSCAERGHYRDQWFMTWDDVRRLHAGGWTIGSHGVEHSDLTAASREEMRDELARSRGRIEAEVGAECRHFAYTWGRHSAEVRRAVAEAGYRSAAGGHHGALRPGFDRLAFARINVDSRWSLDDLAAVMRGDWDYLGWLQRGRLAVSTMTRPKHHTESA